MKTSTAIDENKRRAPFQLGDDRPETYSTNAACRLLGWSNGRFGRRAHAWLLRTPSRAGVYDPVKHSWALTLEDIADIERYAAQPRPRGWTSTTPRMPRPVSPVPPCTHKLAALDPIWRALVEVERADPALADEFRAVLARTLARAEVSKERT